MKELFKSFFLYGITSGISKFIPLFLVPIYTRFFTPAEYGTIDLIQSMIYIVMIFGVVQLDTSLQRYYYEVDDEQRKKESSTIFTSILFVSSILFIVICIFSKTISNLLFTTDEYYSSIIIAAFIIPLSNIASLSFIVIRFMKKPLLFGLIVSVQGAVTALITILLVVYYKLGINGVFYGQALGFLIVNIIQLYVLRNYFSLTWDSVVFKKMIKFALPQFPARIGSTSNAYINRFFMLSLLSASSIGLYSIALKFASVVQLFFGAFLIAWGPYMYETIKNKNHKEEFQKIFKLVCICVLFLVSGMSLFSKELVYLLTTKEFYDAHLLVGGLSLYFGMFFIKELVDLGPQIAEKTIYISYTYIIASLINILSLYFFIHLFDIYGVICSLVLTNLVLILSSWYFSYKLYPIKYSKIIFSYVFVVLLAIVIINISLDLSLLNRILVYISLIGMNLYVFRRILTVYWSQIKIKYLK